MKIKPKIIKIENTNKLRFLIKWVFDFLYKKFTHWFITLYISMFGCGVILVEKKSALIWFLSILFPTLFITAIIYGIVEVTKAVLALIRKIKKIVITLLTPLERHIIEITFKV